MGRRTLLLLSWAASFATYFPAAAQVAAPQPAISTQPEGVAHITLGLAAVPLFGPWKFTVGDSPVDPKTGRRLWAEPDFDDSRWETVDLKPKTGAIDPLSGLSGYVPGWAAKGHPGYWGYAWYRIRVMVQAPPGQDLALAGPADVDDAYQVFDNGQLVGHFGDFTGSVPILYWSRPKIFQLSQANGYGMGSDQDSSMRVLAFRIWMQPFTLNPPEAGGLHVAPVLGEAGAVAASYRMRRLELIQFLSFDIAQALMYGLLAVVAFSLILFDRSDRVYLWMGAFFLLPAAGTALTAVGLWTELIGANTAALITDCILSPLIHAVWVMVWWVWFGRQRPRWLPRLTAGLTLLSIVLSVVVQEIFFGLIPHAIATHFLTLQVAVRLLFFGLLVWVAVEGIRRHGLEGWLVLPVVVLRGIGAFPNELRLVHIEVIWHPFGFTVGTAGIANLLVVAVIALLLLRRLLHSVRRQRLMALDVKQAQEVQRVILPEARLMLAGLTVESEYRPAREVGGDFFQILPNRSDGSLLIVAGDVAGKGLPAGMLVSLLVGAIRTAAETSDEPSGVLSTLNRRLLGRGDAQATCLALRIADDGTVTLANAGHLPPYLNGEPLNMEGALPLGMMEGAEFSVMRFQLKEGDRLMLMSDGIAEARHTDGRLLGFERVNELVRTEKSVAEIARAAQEFGQEDDISVISVTRLPVLESTAGIRLKHGER